MQNPKVPRPSSVSLHCCQVAQSIDTGHSFSPQHLWPLISHLLLLFYNPLPQLTPNLNFFKSVPPLPNPTNNAPFPCTFPNFLFSLHHSSSFLCSLNPSHPSPSLPFPSPSHLVVSLQVNLARYVVDVSSSLVAGRWWWRLRLWKPATLNARDGTS